MCSNVNLAIENKKSGRDDQKSMLRRPIRCIDIEPLYRYKHCVEAQLIVRQRESTLIQKWITCSGDSEEEKLCLRLILLSARGQAT